ncbi:uncharacterized protein LOC132902329 [Amyelois transitella]|uniref:uncharacterized protein LOC132902329 n=1 Tax=Amyelois transitella TaxID=680683 RepID=UPI0029902C1B|nr:uncharacterized protein LOC132902329 [Amyelois transitella]
MLRFGIIVLVIGCARGEIGGSPLMNKLVKVKPVGSNLRRSFVPLTEIPTPPPPVTQVTESARRHLDIDPDDCSKSPVKEVVYEGAKVGIFGDYYDDAVAKTVATVVIPDHIDRKHFEVTTQVPYFTVGLIEAIGYHPSTAKNEYPPECEKIYQDHLADMYSDDTTDYSDESLEVARMPLMPEIKGEGLDEKLDLIYSDME